MYNSSKRQEVTIWCACTSDEWLTAYKKRCWSLLHDETGWDTVAQSLTLVDLKWLPPTSVVSWSWRCIEYISRENEICFGALFKISKKIVLFYYIFYHNSLWWIFLIILTADLISDDSFRFIWYVTLYFFAKEIKAYFLVTLLYKTMLNSKI